MPILTEAGAELGVANGRSIRLPGLPDFNADNPDFRINSFEGWFDGQGPTPVLVGRGGAPGAVAVGDWNPAESYYTLGGRIFCDPADRATWRRLLLSAFPPGVETSLLCLGNDQDVDLQVFVRLVDKPQIVMNEAPIAFALPLVAPDPFKYATAALTDSMGVFAGVDWFRTYANATTWHRQYANVDGRWTRTYERSGSDGQYPLSVGFDSPGDATSQRVSVDVVGPLPSGWWVERLDSDGVGVERVWAQTALADGQTLTLDTQTRSARLNGADVSHLAFGDFLTLPAGASTFRLVAPSDLGGHASVTALPAYL